jgi:DNA-binding transcriptional ArsR family regulator
MQMSKNKEKRRKELERERERLEREFAKLQRELNHLTDEEDRVVIIRNGIDEDEIEFVQPLPPLPPRPPKPAKPAEKAAKAAKVHPGRAVRVGDLSSEMKAKIQREKERIRKERDNMSKEIQQMKKELQTKKNQFNKQRSEYENIRRDLRDKEREIRAKERMLRDQKYGSYTWDIDLDEDIEGMTTDLESQLGQYTKSILKSVADSLRTSMGIAVKGTDDIGIAIGEVGKKVGDISKEIGEKIAKDVHVTIGPSIPNDKLEEFYEIGAQIVSAIGDKNRLKILKTLEKEPMYQTQLSESTNIKGGTFSHHMKILMDDNVKFVTQEVVRRRYLLTTRGREALKLAEIQFMRYLKDLESGDEEYDVKVK